MEWLLDREAWAALAALTVLEVVLGVDNVIFITVLAGKLPAADRPRARRLGLFGAFATRLALLFSLAWLVQLTKPLLSPFGHAVSGKDLLLLVGGLFLIAKATFEIHGKLEGEHEAHAARRVAHSLGGVILQIMLIDMVFSLDSVLTAVGMARQLWVMVAANVLALGIMLWSAGPIGAFVEHHPTVKMLALAFLVLIGANLVAEGAGQHIPKGYTYFAMAFSTAVEMLNLKLRARAERAVRLREQPAGRPD